MEADDGGPPLLGSEGRESGGGRGGGARGGAEGEDDDGMGSPASRRCSPLPLLLLAISFFDFYLGGFSNSMPYSCLPAVGVGRVSLEGAERERELNAKESKKMASPMEKEKPKL
jgi:hypothetical protein